MQPDYDAIVATPVGHVGVLTGVEGVTALDLGLDRRRSRPPRTALAAQVAAELAAYFNDASHRFEFPLSLHGTSFQRRVWAALQSIPVGETLSYGALARRLGTAARAVGGACRANPCPIVVPCHRVVAADDGLGGYSGHRGGAWLDIKGRLLSHERSCR